MVTKESISAYQYPALIRSENSLVIAPHVLLRSFIANYTFTSPRTMPEQQVVLPSASTTLVCSIGSSGVINGLRGVNTKPTMIGNYARQFDFMFLIEFHSAGLYPFIRVDQNLLLNDSFSFEEINKSLNQQITEAYYLSSDIRTLKCKLDNIFLSKLNDTAINSTIVYAMKKVLESRGMIRTKELAKDVYYSEKQLNRLFQKYVGTGAKTFSRIVRMKHAADLLDSTISLSQLAEITGHYDQAHLVHDFKNIYGLTPGEYVDKMSLFYNDSFKLNQYNEVEKTKTKGAFYYDNAIHKL